MFWRLRAAEFCGDVAQVAPVASVEFRSLFASRITSESPRRFSRDPAVGKVELIEAVRDESQGFDRLQVVVRWSGVLCEGDPRGSFREVYANAIRTHVFTLLRRTGVKSKSETTFSSASCSQCGAPIAVSNDSACPFCGTSLNDGRYDWVLNSVEAWSARHAIRQSGGSPPGALDATPPSRPPGHGSREFETELSLAALAKIAACDGQIDDSERKARSPKWERDGDFHEKTSTPC